MSHCQPSCRIWSSNIFLCELEELRSTQSLNEGAIKNTFFFPSSPLLKIIKLKFQQKNKNKKIE